MAEPIQLKVLKGHGAALQTRLRYACVKCEGTRFTILEGGYVYCGNVECKAFMRNLHVEVTP